MEPSVAGASRRLASARMARQSSGFRWASRVPSCGVWAWWPWQGGSWCGGCGSTTRHSIRVLAPFIGYVVLAVLFSDRSERAASAPRRVEETTVATSEPWAASGAIHQNILLGAEPARGRYAGAPVSTARVRHTSCALGEAPWV